MAFVDYVKYKLNRLPSDDELKTITNIITWNFWQMDGITGSVPFKKACKEETQLSLFDFGEDKKTDEIDCVIFDWENNKEINYKDLKK